MSLTSPDYWSKRQKGLGDAVLGKPIRELIDVVAPFIEEGANFMELGCSPGIVSAWLGRIKALNLFGVDFSPEAHTYLQNVKRICGGEPVLYNCDLFQFESDMKFDVVASFGLIEHFVDPMPAIRKHYELCRPGGLVIIGTPNFRYVQYLYHLLLDGRDLSVHNLKVMNLDFFNRISDDLHLTTLLLGHFGTMSFWNFDNEGIRLAAMLRKIAAKGLCLLTDKFFSKVLPGDNKVYSPWIVYVGKRN